MADIERTIRYATSVHDLPAAWAFVMEHLDDVGPNPDISIRPSWWSDGEVDAEWVREFGVTVSGMVKE